MPVGLYDGKNVVRFSSTSDAWKKLMSLANDTVHITAFYWTLLANDTGEGFKWDDSAQTVRQFFSSIKLHC
jgi:hypothetical protein